MTETTGEYLTRPLKEDGYIMQMQNFSVNDGEGIRTTIFLCGCPLHCIWCCNPENGFYSDDAHHMTLEEVDRRISRQALFYRRCGGGITFSGGEATVQQGFLRAMVNRFYDKGYDLSLETCGAFCFEELEDILRKMSLIFMDLKLFDDALHELFTGSSNARILENIRRTALLGIPLVIRIPVIVGVNAFEQNIEDTCRFLEENAPEARLEFLPYHRYGMDKYAALGIPDADARYELVKKQKMGTDLKEECPEGKKPEANGLEQELLEGKRHLNREALPDGFFFADKMEIPSEELLQKYREIAASHHMKTVSWR